MDPLSLIAPGADLAGGIINAVTSGNNNSNNLAESKDFAQHGVQWRVQDAKEAGISPLAALGANLSSPVASMSDSSLGDAFGRAGQDFSRAALSSQGEASKDAHALNLRMIHGADLDNSIKATQLAKLQAAGSGPGIPDAFIKVKNYDGSISIVPSHDAVGAGFFPASRYNWEGQNFLPGAADPPNYGLGLGMSSADMQTQINSLYGMGTK